MSIRCKMVYGGFVLTLVSSCLLTKGGDNLPVATITDNKGASNRVTGVRALYRATGMWIGTTPSKAEATLYIELSKREGHIVARETRKIPFSEIRTIRVDGKFLQTRRMALSYNIEKRDGAKLIAVRKGDDTSRSKALTMKNPTGSWSLTETNAQGQETNSDVFVTIQLSAERRKSGSSQEEYVMRLSEITGIAETKSGQKGDFEISFDDVKTISFE